MLRSADWRWGIAALAFSAVTYVGAALSLTGFVTERLNFLLTILVQLAGSFVTLVTPAAVGGAALNIRYLQREKITAPIAAAICEVIASWVCSRRAKISTTRASLERPTAPARG